MDHLAEKTGYCFLTAVWYNAPLGRELVTKLDAEDSKAEKLQRRAGTRHNFSDQHAVQAEGPLRVLILPLGHSRQSRKRFIIPALQTAMEWNPEDGLQPTGGVCDPTTELHIADLQTVAQTGSDVEDDMPLDG